MNGIDRVFVSALNTVKRLPSTPNSPKPPLEDRLLLYGLFKQSMEGDVPESILATLDIEPVDEEEDANREKTEAWAQQRGTSKTEAKKLYISTLIRSMREHGSKTETARALIDELEFVWNQVNGNNDDESFVHSRSNSGSQSIRQRQPVGRPNEDEADEDDAQPDELSRTLPNVYRTAQNSPSKALQPQRTGDSRLLIPSALTLGNTTRGTTAAGDEKWKRQVELSLQQIRAELASVRESLLHTNSSSSSLFGSHSTSQSFLSILFTRAHRLLKITIMVVAYDLVFLTLVWYVFRRRGDIRAKKVEDWVRRLWNWTLAKVRVQVRTGVRHIGDRR